MEFSSLAILDSGLVEIIVFIDFFVVIGVTVVVVVVEVVIVVVVLVVVVVISVNKKYVIRYLWKYIYLRLKWPSVEACRQRWLAQQSFWPCLHVRPLETQPHALDFDFILG